MSLCSACPELYAGQSTPYSFNVLCGPMTPKWTILENPLWYVLRGHGFACCGQIWWKSATGKLTKCLLILQTKPQLHGTRPTPPPSPFPFCPHWDVRAENFLNVVSAGSVHDLVQMLGVCQSYSRKIAFSDPQSHCNVGWSLYTVWVLKNLSPPSPEIFWNFFLTAEKKIA